MPPRDRPDLLDDILREINFVEDLGAQLDLDRYDQDETVQRAVERSLYIVGEAVRQLRQFYPSTAARITDAGQIVVFRNVLAHDYARVDPLKVLSVIRRHLPLLRADVEALRSDVGGQ